MKPSINLRTVCLALVALLIVVMCSQIEFRVPVGKARLPVTIADVVVAVAFIFVVARRHEPEPSVVSGFLDQLQRAGVCLDNATRARIALQLQQGGCMPGRKSHRMPAPSLANRRDDVRTLIQPGNNRLDNALRDAGHIGQRNDPAACLRAGCHTAGNARAHAVPGARVIDDLESFLRKRSCQLALRLCHYRNTAWQYGHEVPGSGNRHGGAVRQWMQQFVGAETGALPGGQQDAGSRRCHAVLAAPLLA